AITTIVHRESTPPAFYLLARTSDRVVTGLKPASRARAVRALPLAFSVGCTLLTFLLACELLPLWGAALAGVLAAFATQLVVHGSELRSYPVLAFACVAFAVVLERAATRPSLTRLALLSITAAFASLTHYFFLFTFAAGVLWLLLSGLPRTALARVGVALAIGLVPLAIWSPNWLRQYRNGIYGTAPRPFNLGRVLDLFPSLLAPQPFVTDTSLVTHTVTSIGAAMPVLVTLAVLVPGVLLLRHREGRLCGLLLVVPFALVTVLVAVTGERVFSSRNLIGIVPFAAVALAWGCVALPWRRVSYAAGLLVGALVVAGFAYGQVSFGRTPYDRIAGAMIAQGFRPGEPIVWFGASGGSAPVGWYLTSHEPADSWPRLVHARPRKTGACRALEVVARTQAGHDWLAQHADDVLAQTSLPQYGDVPQAARQSVDATVARVRFRPGILERPAGATNWLLFRVAGTPSPCVR
ncbi:MAG TPA: glycosyltransferase family 39 protein, partial [Acidimicrobiales bacterium]|nr:glycosyltransferase family 39 protein [Acidimicrobiales bacterium]